MVKLPLLIVGPPGAGPNPIVAAKPSRLLCGRFGGHRGTLEAVTVARVQRWRISVGGADLSRR